MITGTHLLLYSRDPEADRAFIRDVLELRTVDAGGGWLLFAMPPAELGVHPVDDQFVQRHADEDLIGAVLYLMCDDLRATMRALESRQGRCGKIVEAEWGLATTVRLPSGPCIGLYQPTHPLAIEPAAPPARRGA